MGLLSSLTVALNTDTAKFDNGLKRSRKSAQQFSKAIGTAFTAGAVGAAALTAGLITLTKQSLKLVDAQRKNARVLGITQGEYAGLSLAAGIAGVEVAAFDKALKRQQKSIVDAGDGLQTQARALDRLGLSTDDLLRKNPVEQFKAITTALGQVENQTLKVAIASDLYGARNAQLINAIELGGEGIDFYISKVRELGVALDSQATDNIEAANDAVLVAKTAFQGLGNQLAAEFAPAIVAAAEGITGFVSSVARGIPDLAAFARGVFGIRAEVTELSLAGLKAERRRIEADLQFSSDVIKNLTLQRNRVLASGGKDDAFVKRLQEQTQESIELAAALDKVVERIDEISAKPVTTGDQAALTPGQAAVGAPAGGPQLPLPTGGFLDEFIGSEIDESISQWQRWRDEAVAAIEATRTPQERLQERIFQLRKDFDENPFINEETFSRQASLAVDAYLAELDSLNAGTESTFDAVREFSTQAARNMQNAFADFLFDPFEDGLDGMLKGFADTLRRMVANLLASQIFSFFSSQFGGAFAGVVSGQRAIGGPVSRGGAYVTGENGRELFTPGASGSIRPLGAVTINQELSFNGSDSADPAVLIPILEENNRKLKAELLDEFDRGSFV